MKIYKFNKIFNFLPKSKIKAGDGKKEGKYPLYTSSPILSKYYNEYLYENESLVFGTGGQPSLHYVNNKFSTSTDCFTVEKKDEFEEKVYTKYVYYFFKSNNNILEDGFKGAGLKHISKKYLSNIKIPLPKSIDDQIKIANLLSQVEALIAKREESIKLLDELLKSTFLDMFGDPVLNVKEWDKVPLSKLGKINRGVSKHRPRNAPELLGGKYPLIQTGDVSNADLYVEKFTQTYSDIGLAQSKLWKKDTLCITIAANIAKTAILKFDACFPDSVVGMEINKNETNLFYVHFLFKFFQKLLEKNAPQAAQKNINLQILRNLKVPQPDKPLQDKFATIVKQIEESKKKYQESLNELHQLFDSLSQRAFKGELDLSGVEAPVADKVIDVKSHKVDSIAGGENTQATLDIPTLMRKANIDEHIERVDSYTDNTNRPVYSEDFLWMVLSQADDEISYESIASKLEKYSFEEYPDYDRIKSDIFSLIEQKKLKQLFDEDNKSIRLVKAT